MIENQAEMSFFEKIKNVRKLIEQTFPDMDGDSLMTALCRVAHWHYDKKSKMLGEKEMILYDLLLRNNYCPSTVYKWFLLTKVPEDIKGRIKRQEISQKQALRMASNRRHCREINLGLQMMEQARAIIGGL